MKIHFLTLAATALFSALLVLLTASASQAGLIWNVATGSPNGEFTNSTTQGSAISYGTLTFCDGTMQDYAVVLNDAFNLRGSGTTNPAVAANNMFAVHPDGSADLYSSIEGDGFVDISVFTYATGTYTGTGTVFGTGTPVATQFGVTAPNFSPNTVTGSDGNLGANIARLNNNEELFSMTPITSVFSPGLQIETNIPGDPTNLGTNFALPTGFSTALAWEAATGNPFPGNTLQVSEADFNVTFAATSELRLRRDADAGQNSAFGFAAAVPEPSSAAFLTLGGLGLLVRRKKR